MSFSVPFPVKELQTHATMSRFYMGAGDLNSGLHKGAASTLTTELSPQFLTLYFLHITTHLVMHKGQGRKGFSALSTAVIEHRKVMMRYLFHVFLC